MKRNQCIKVLVFLFAVALSSSVMSVQAKATTSKKQITTNNVITQDAKEDEAQAAVEALFTDETCSAINPDITQVDLDKAQKLVDALAYGPVKEELSILMFRAQLLFNQLEGQRIVYALFRDSEHTTIRNDLTQAEIVAAGNFVENKLAAGPIKVQLRILIIIAYDQLEIRDTVYALFTDDAHTTIKPDLKQSDIDKAKQLVDGLSDEWPIKKELSALIKIAQKQLDEKILKN